MTSPVCGSEVLSILALRHFAFGSKTEPSSRRHHATDRCFHHSQHRGCVSTGVMSAQGLSRKQRAWATSPCGILSYEQSAAQRHSSSERSAPAARTDADDVSGYSASGDTTGWDAQSQVRPRQEPQIICGVCSTALPVREGEFALKYFMLRELAPVQTAKRQGARGRTVRRLMPKTPPPTISAAIKNVARPQRHIRLSVSPQPRPNHPKRSTHREDQPAVEAAVAAMRLFHREARDAETLASANRATPPRAGQRRRLTLRWSQLKATP
jgi:hypothetical protein